MSIYQICISFEEVLILFLFELRVLLRQMPQRNYDTSTALFAPQLSFNPQAISGCAYSAAGTTAPGLSLYGLPSKYYPNRQLLDFISYHCDMTHAAAICILQFISRMLIPRCTPSSRMRSSARSVAWRWSPVKTSPQGLCWSACPRVSTTNTPRDNQESGKTIELDDFQICG